jgi:S1-C subfamily serine protease
MHEGSGYGPYGYADPPGGAGSGAYYGPAGYPSPGGFPPPPPRRRGRGFLSHLFVAVLAAAVGIGATVALDHSSAGNSLVNATPALPGASAVPSPGATGSGSGGTTGEQAVINKVEPGLVIMQSAMQYSGDEGFATGMVINSDGLVLTNNHVIEDSTKLTARDLSNGKTYTAAVLGYDKTGDIALVKLQGASGLRTVPLGDSAAVKTGNTVMALGNAEGQGSIVPAVGEITAVNQTINASDEGGSITSETLHGMLETNANIVQGDSGGPLSNASGQVIGMTTASNSSSVSVGEQAAPNEGWAIPINTALAIASQIAAGHANSTISIGYPPFIGIFLASGTSSNPQQQASEQEQSNGNGFGGNGSSCYTSNSNLIVPSSIAPVSSGTLIDGVICGSPAANAGMTGGAVITAVNGQAAGSPDNLTSILAKLKPGETAAITWVSPSGQSTTSNLHLAAGPPQ